MMSKRAFFVASIVTMLNAAGLVGVGAWAAARGYLARDRVRGALAVLRGEATASTPNEAADGGESPAPTSQAAQAAPGDAMQDQLRRLGEADEITRTELERRSREIASAWKLLEMQQLAVVREREALAEERQRFVDEQAEKARERKDGGLAKELEILGGLKAKDGKELLRLKPDADVVRIFMALDARVGRKIVAECKAPEERLWIGRILDQLHERNASRADRKSVV